MDLLYKPHYNAKASGSFYFPSTSPVSANTPISVQSKLKIIGPPEAFEFTPPLTDVNILNSEPKDRHIKQRSARQL